jgi:hypothetical protein
MDEERKRALKRQVRDHERSSFLSAMPLTLSQASGLIEALNARLEQTSCDHTHRLTREWCEKQGFDPDAVIPWARDHGGYCDCELAANLSDPIEDAGKLQE